MMVMLDLVVIIKMNCTYIMTYRYKNEFILQQFRFAKVLKVVDITYVQYWKQIALNFGHWFL